MLHSVYHTYVIIQPVVHRSNRKLDVIFLQNSLPAKNIILQIFVLPYNQCLQGYVVNMVWDMYSISCILPDYIISVFLISIIPSETGRQTSN